jgi:serine/threonine protein kinase
MATSWIPKISDEFGSYRLEELIGHGGMSIVFRARDLALDRSVALKLLAPDLSEDSSFQERFTRESRLVASLDHPNVIPIYEAGEQNGVFYIAMRYVPGSNLKELLQRDGPLDRAQTISVIGQIASALTAAHAMGLVHRDVKPANVLIAEGAGADDSHHVYLSDFGIAKQQVSNVTRTGMFIGTAHYASPEQIEGKDLDARSDVYSLGCVLYECLTGSRAYDKDSEVALIYAHLLEPPPSMSASRPELAAAIDPVVAKAMAKKPEDRYASAKDFAAAVREALSQPLAEASVVQPSPVAQDDAPPPPSATSQVAAAAASPGAGDPPAPPGDTAAPQPPRPPGGISRTRIGIAAGLLAVAVAGVILAVVLLGGDDKKPAAQTQSSTTQQTQPTTQQTQPQTQPVKPVSLLDALFTTGPTGIAGQCKTASAASYGAVITEACTSPASAPISSPHAFSFSFFRSRAALLSAYDQVKKGFGPADCGGTAGQRTWHHQSTGKTGGLVACGVDAKTGDSIIVWTHEKLGSVDHVDMLGFARVSGRGANLFANWWGKVRNYAGKCRPALPADVCIATVQQFEKSG